MRRTLFLLPLIVGSLNAQTRHRLQLEPMALSTAQAQGERNSPHLIAVGGAQIEVDVHLGQAGLSVDDVLTWVRRAAEAVTVYYRRFPVQHVRVTITQNPEGGRAIHGTTWGDIDGFQGVTRMRIGQAVSRADLDNDWTMTHELVHMALTSLSDENSWLEEGLATYVEPIARAQVGQLSPASVWKGMFDGMWQGEPVAGDRGLDRTHTWGRTYWGGALFCLVADVEIRRATGNQKSLQDAARAIVASGATIDTERSLTGVLRIGDQATGTAVLENLYDNWKDKPVIVDLDRLWSELGVQPGPQGIVFDESAPAAEIRRSMTQPPR